MTYREDACDVDENVRLDDPADAPEQVEVLGQERDDQREEFNVARSSVDAVEGDRVAQGG